MSEAATEVTIRPARLEDAEALAEIYITSAEHHMRLDPSMYTEPDHDAMVARYTRRIPGRPDAAILVAEVGGEVIGWLEIILRQPTGEPRMNREAVQADIDLAVRPDHRGAGVGTSLVRAAEAWAVEHGAELVTLEVHVANVDAIRFYQERLGFRTTGLTMMKRP